MPAPAYKICPACQTPAALDAPACARCGHAYRTRFSPHPATDEKPTRPVRRKWPIIVSVAAALLLAAFLLPLALLRADLAPVPPLSYPSYPVHLVAQGAFAPASIFPARAQDAAYDWSIARPDPFRGDNGLPTVRRHLLDEGRVAIVDQQAPVRVIGSSRRYPGLLNVRVLSGPLEGAYGWVSAWDIGQTLPNGYHYPYADGKYLPVTPRGGLE